MRLHVEHLLIAYIHDELPPHLRARVSRHVQHCDWCYAALRREEDLARLLQAEMPVVGTPTRGQLNRLLPGILAEVTPRPAPRSSFRGAGFAVALVVTLLVALFVPALSAPRAVASYAPSQPVGPAIAATATQSTTDTPSDVPVYLPTAVAQHVVLATDLPETDPPPAPIAQATPGQY
jgi:anti-sigma factor RsiW